MNRPTTLRIVAFFAVLLISTGISIRLAGGHPLAGFAGLGDINLTQGLVSLIGLLIILALIAGLLWFIGNRTFSSSRLAVIVLIGTIIVVVLGYLGMRFLLGPIWGPTTMMIHSPGVWWPVITLIAGLIGLALLGRLERRR